MREVKRRCSECGTPIYATPENIKNGLDEYIRLARRELRTAPDRRDMVDRLLFAAHGFLASMGPSGPDQERCSAAAELVELIYLGTIGWEIDDDVTAAKVSARTAGALRKAVASLRWNLRMILGVATHPKSDSLLAQRIRDELAPWVAAVKRRHGDHDEQGQILAVRLFLLLFEDRFEPVERLVKTDESVDLEDALKDELDYLDANASNASARDVSRYLVLRALREYGFREPHRLFKSEELRRRRGAAIVPLRKPEPPPR